METRFIETKVVINGANLFVKAFRDGAKVLYSEVYCYTDISSLMPNYVTKAINEAIEARIAEIDGTPKETKDE